MSDLSVMVERVAEAEELERLRREVAELKARWDDYAAVSARAFQLGYMNAYGQHVLSGQANSLQSATYLGQLQAAPARIPSPYGSLFGTYFP